MKTERKKVSCIGGRSTACPSSVIERFNINPGDKVMLVCRVSSKPQENTNNLYDQERRLRLAVRRAGGQVVGVIQDQASGFVEPEHQRKNWFKLLYAESFKAQQAGAILLAESTSRFVRHAFYNSSKRPSFGPTYADLRNLRCETRGLRLMTLVDPDASFREERSQQTKRGLAAKSRRGKGPVRASEPGAIKERRLAKLLTVLELHQQGLSSRDIELETGIPKTTVNRWLSDR